jgi:predicted lipoprotein with Yx(FWY)xxD motif
MSPRTRILTRAIAPAVVGLLVLGACTSSTEGSAGASSEAAAASSAAAAPSEAAESQAESQAASGDATVLVADSDLGEILTDAEGMTIYFFANDTEGTSNCEGDCLENWPPVTVDGEPTAGEGVTAELGTTEGTDGSTQLTVNEFPAYYFAGDSAEGDTNGQGVGDVWWVFGADGEPIEE